MMTMRETMRQAKVLRQAQMAFVVEVYEARERAPAIALRPTVLRRAPAIAFADLHPDLHRAAMPTCQTTCDDSQATVLCCAVTRS